MGQAMREVVGAKRVKLEISVRGVLEWAFADECASVDFDEFRAPAGRDTIAVLMDRGLLGCKVDGGRMGGGAQSADDAEIVAGVVASLPVARGGRGMAVKVAEYARAGSVPDVYAGVVSSWQPLEWRINQHGPRAMSCDTRDMVFGNAGRFAVAGVRACPVRLVPSLSQIGAARRFYLDWVGALRHIRNELQDAGLSRWEVTDALPPVAPWVACEKNS